PPPIAMLASRMSEAAIRCGAPTPRLDALEPELLSLELDRGGWRLEPPSQAAAATPAPTTPEIVRCEGLSHVFARDAGGRRALDGIDLAIREGEMVAILGANGSGKTTLARHMSGLLRPTVGRALYRGE